MSKHDLEFRKMIVSLYENGTSVSELVTDYDLSKPTIYSWIKKYKQHPLKSDGETMSLDDIHKMKREIARIKEENDILKKCIAIFSDKKKDR